MKKFTIALLALLSMTVGCTRPFEPIDLKPIKPNEYAFLVPYGDTNKQESVSSEEYWTKNKVMAKEVRIPKKWVATGREYAAGEWKDDAVLILVSGSPVTREWTADASTGTSTKNQAIWTMTADQIEWTVAWTVTARIDTIEDAAKFLSFYPNGSLEEVLDNEVRGRLITVFNMAVTDLPMKELQEHASPVFTKTADDVTKFFKTRGISITNLGPAGPFVYKNKSITEVMEQRFVAKQQAEINQSKTAAKTEENKSIQLVAEAKAKAILTEQKAIADGVKLVADAKAYEITQANKDLATYLSLKRLENDAKLIEKWTGVFPSTFMGPGSPTMLLKTEAGVAK
jgi:hypothetical protein